MLFVELRFLVFFVAVFGVHWALPWNRARKAWLLACSYAFYAAWDWRFLGLILLSTGVDYAAALWMERAPERRRLALWTSLATNLGLLGVFKYLGFFAESAAELLELLGFHASLPVLRVVLPVGISFYTFQTLSYTLDVYFGRLRPTRSLLDMALFVAFFPQLVAGPIVRARDILPQLDARRVLAHVDVLAAATLFFVGFFKKACVSDNLAPLVDAYFAAPGDFDVLSGYAAVLAYAVQIYCDFSGYSDMAIACAALLGYRLCLNFHFPYLATSVTEFWRRWHISLSTWLRDYLYIPLGGKRGSRASVYRNVLLTMLLGGLWHGAAWTFVIWGGLHGLALIVHREWRRLAPDRPPSAVGAALGCALTFVVVCAAWVFFRAPSLAAATSILESLATLRSPGTGRVGREFLALLPALALLHALSYVRAADGLRGRVPAWGYGAALGLAAALALTLIPHQPTPFIYFQF